MDRFCRLLHAQPRQYLNGIIIQYQKEGVYFGIKREIQENIQYFLMKQLKKKLPGWSFMISMNKGNILFLCSIFSANVYPNISILELSWLAFYIDNFFINSCSLCNKTYPYNFSIWILRSLFSLYATKKRLQTETFTILKKNHK